MRAGPWRGAVSVESNSLEFSLVLLIIMLVLIVGRGLHSSTFQLNLSAFCGIGGTFRGCLGGV